MKIIDKINQKVDEGTTFYSFEYFPPKTEEGVKNLHDRQKYMKSLDPLFCDITWGAGGSTADLTLTIAEKMQTEINMETMMHLTCTNMPVEKLEAALQQCKQAGIKNILALRGDPPHGEEKFTQVEGGFSCALDLVKYIREKHGDYFGICVSGYPEAHPDQIVEDPEEMKKKYWEDIEYLKKKVEAGADFIITQLFYDVDLFLKFVVDCKSAGINAPILPGIMPIMNYGGFKRMTSFCKTYVPEHISNVLEAIKDNDAAIKAYGISLGTQMCQRLLDSGVPGVHMYTLNLDKSAVGILKNIGLVSEEQAKKED